MHRVPTYSKRAVSLDIKVQQRHLTYYFLIAASSSSSSAQLMLKLPTGQAVHLSDMPIIQQAPPVPQPVKKKQNKSAPETKRELLLERNRAAAQRSRAKKKLKGQEMSTELQTLKTANERLSVENDLYRVEISKLKSLLAQHVDCSVTLAGGENAKQTLLRELKPQFVIHKK